MRALGFRSGWDVKMLGLKRVHINRLKVIAWRCWNDGIDVDVRCPRVRSAPPTPYPRAGAKSEV